MPMRVKVELLPGLRPIRGEKRFEIELNDGATVKELLLSIGFRENEIEHLRVWVGKDMASLHTVLKDSDEVTMGVPLGGG
jgi:molybdopterin converting factor small subunit